MQRNREIARLEQEKQAKFAEELKQKKVQETKARAEEIAKQDPSFSLPVEPERVRTTLGSMDPKDSFPFLVTLDNQGAAIERIELVGQKKTGSFDYRSLRFKEREGYLGYLALDERPSSLNVNSVPKGSAAANAVCKEDPSLVGLKPGDQIIGWDELSGSPSLYKLEKRLGNQPAGNTIELKIQRAVPKNEQATPEPAVNAAESGAVASANEGIPTFTFVCTLTERPLDVLRAEDDFDAEQVIGNDPVLSCLTTLASVDATAKIEGTDPSIMGMERTLKGRWNVKPLEVERGMGVEYSMPLRSFLKVSGAEANLELVKQYRLLAITPEQAKDPNARTHHLQLTTIVRNLDDKPHSVAIRQEGLNGISLEGWWYPTKISPFFFSAAGARDVIVGDGLQTHTLLTTRAIVANATSFPSDPDLGIFGPADTLPKRTVRYVGLDTQSFTAAMLPSPDSPESMSNLQRAKAVVLNSAYTDLNRHPSSKQQATNVGFWFETDTKVIQPGSEWKLDYEIFAAPKDPIILGAYKLDDAIEYGWWIFGFFAKRLGWILHFFFYLTSNFGVAIMLLTVLVRSCMFPVSRKMALNAQKMQSVQPHTAKLKEMLKDDPRKMMAAQQMLMKKAGINQFAGCLPALIQLPIVIGLYRCVSVDVGLRQQSLVPGWDWCSNLAGPDMFLDWHSWMPDFIAGRGSGWFGPYLNILPIITIALFIVQQKVLMPKATDEQSRIAQQMMMVMTIMMGVLFFKVPAGLCIYFITSSTWSLVERFLIKRFTPQSAQIDLPDNTAAEIIAALGKGTSVAARPSSSPTKDDKPRPKATKPPETLTELWENVFGKKPQAVTEPSPENKKSQAKAQQGRAKRNRNK
jgi:YidC/Oxa1 family membrane protein insertase